MKKSMTSIVEKEKENTPGKKKKKKRISTKCFYGY